MLWYKGWLETRIKLAITLALFAAFLIFMYMHQQPVTVHNQLAAIRVVAFPSLGAMWIFALLAGAGIATQPGFQATKGIHGSTLYTLSLPVSRLQLVTVRAVIGWLESAAVIGALCLGTWLLSPALRATVTGAEFGEYSAAILICGSPIYFLSVWLATFLDEQWRIWATLLVTYGWIWLAMRASLPAFANLTLGKASPLVAHTMPWTTLGFAVGLSAAMFVAALQVARAREY